MTAAASGPKASTHDDVGTAGVGAAVVAYVGVEAGVAAGAAGEDMEKGPQAVLMVASVGATSVEVVVVVNGVTVFPALDNDEPQNKSSKPPPVLLLLVVTVVVATGSTSAAAASEWCRKQVVERWCGAVIEVIVVICSSRIITTKIEQIDGSGGGCQCRRRSVEDGGVAKDGDR